MSTEYIQDNRLKSFWQRQIFSNEDLNHTKALDGLKYCGSQAIPISDGLNMPAVYIIREKSTAETKIANLMFCHSAWACPHCTPRVMAEKGNTIACAIDALAKWYQQKAFMITFTIPHDNSMSLQYCKELMKRTWRSFTRNGKKQTRKYNLKISTDRKNTWSYKDNRYLNEYDKRAVGQIGEERIYDVRTDIWGIFREELQIKHWVKVYEVTWSEENGWHFHIHALFWTHKDNFSKIADYQDELYNRWWITSKRQYQKLLNEKYPDQPEKNAEIANTYFSNQKKYADGIHRSLYISQDKNGNIRPISSSNYIAGWGGNMELTASYERKNCKKEGHYTPFQILRLAQQDYRLKDYYLSIFAEYAIATRATRRVEWAKKSGIAKIIQRWKQSEEYTKLLKKKVMDADKEWHVVVWFKLEQWKFLFWYNNQTDDDHISEILELARAPDGKQLIEQYLLSIDDKFLDITNNKRNHFCEEIEFRMNCAC